MTLKLKMFTDGSSDVGGGAAASVLVKGGHTPFKVVFWLGEASAVESELCAMILGLGAVRQLSETGGIGDYLVDWAGDSLTLVESARKMRDGGEVPCALRGYWELLPALWMGMDLQLSHVAAHSGERGNEACDRACRWVRRQGPKLLRRYGEGAIGLKAKKRASEAWVLMDGSEVIGVMRSSGDVLLRGEVLRNFCASVIEKTGSLISVNGAAGG